MIKAALTIIGLICVLFLGIVIAVCGLFQLQQQQTKGSGTFSSVATAALALQQRVYGSRSNQYNDQDPFMQSVIGYWAKVCPGSGPHGICTFAQSGNLQCVEFVTAAYFLGGDPLPQAPDAEQFWDAYAHQSGWHQIPSPSAFPTAAKQTPNLGDLIVFKGGAHLENGNTVEYGHIGVVVNFQAPSATQNGSIEVAEGNGPGTKFPPQSTHPWVASDKPGNTYLMTVHPDYTISTWGPYTLDGVAYSGMTVLGFLHHTLPANGQTKGQSTQNAQSLPTNLSFSTPYVQEAWNDAEKVGMPVHSHHYGSVKRAQDERIMNMILLNQMTWIVQFVQSPLPHMLLASLLATSPTPTALPATPTDPTGVNAAMLELARLAAGFIGGTLAVVLVMEGYQYMFSDSASRGVHLKRAIAIIIGGAILVILGVTIAQPIVSAISGH
jgi:hypothetical protein